MIQFLKRAAAAVANPRAGYVRIFANESGELQLKDEAGSVTSIGSGGSGSVDWGDIGGTLADQTDLQSALDAKQAAGSYAAASHTHSISDVTGLSAALAFRGALVKKAADQTGANYTSSTNVAWDAETYDTSGIHDNSTNNTRLTVPAGASLVRLSCVISISSITADVWTQAIIWKNGSGAWDGIGKITVESGDTTPSVAAYSAVVQVAPGDYFEVNLTIETDTSVTIVASGSWFAMEVIE